MEYTVYIRVDDAGRVVSINSNAFLPNIEGWVEIDKGRGDKYQHAQGNYMPGPIFNSEGIPVYKMEMGKIVNRTEDEMRADVQPKEKTAFERLSKVEESMATITNIISKLGLK